jgi:hypothetical protein
MKHEKTVPYGVPIAADESVANLAKYALTALLTAGGQLSTKMYMAASNNDWIEPTSIILGSSFITLTASRIVGFEIASSSSPLLALLLPLPATFSFQVKAANNPPKIKKPTDNSNGPLGPLVPAAKPAICPAKIATIESPAYANPNVSPNDPSNPFLAASPTNHASGALNNKLVPIPPITRPANNTPKTLLLVLIAPSEYNNEKTSVPALRPYVSQRRPTSGPKSAVEANPVRKRRETHVMAELPADPKALEAYTW